MKDFLEVYSELFQYVLEKSYGWALFLLMVLIAIIAAIITAFVFQKIIVPARTLQTVKLEREKKELAKQLKALKKENNKLNKKLQDFKLEQAIEDSVNEHDPFVNS